MCVNVLPNMCRCVNGSIARGCSRQRRTLQIGYHNQVHWQVSQLLQSRADDVICVIVWAAYG